MKVGELPVRDGKRDWRIVITAEDVKDAVPRSECDCAIAKAIRRTLAAGGRVGKPSVGREVVIVKFPGSHIERYLLSPNDHALVRTFDRADVFPDGYTVELRAPRGIKRLGKRPPRSALSKRRGPHTTKNEQYPYHPRHVKLPRDIADE
jgi:hypothetical protein